MKKINVKRIIFTNEFFWVIFMFACAALLLLVSRENYLLFHSIVEFFVSLICFSIFIIAINTFRFAKNGFYLFLGTSFFFYTLLNFLHIISYSGVNILSVGTNIPTQIWVAERFLLSLTFLFANVFLGKQMNLYKYLPVVLVQALFTILVVSSIFYFKNFPETYNSAGLTNFKIISEYAISAVMVVGWVALLVRKKSQHSQMFYYMSWAILFSILAEIAFTRYVGVYGNFNRAGHLLIFFSVYFIYIIFIRRALQNPYTVLFSELKEANRQLERLAVIDGLTGIYNYSAAMQRISDQYEVAKRLNHKFSLIMIDLDKFKGINDQYGHVAGDKVLVEFAHILKESVRKIDIVGRFGGDEFIICPVEASRADAVRIVKKIEEAVVKNKVKIGKKQVKIQFSVGVHSCLPKKTSSLKIESIVRRADNFLLIEKRSKRDLLAVSETARA